MTLRSIPTGGVVFLVNTQRTMIYQESIKDDFIVITSDNPDARLELSKLIQDREWVNMGYNIKNV